MSRVSEAVNAALKDLADLRAAMLSERSLVFAILDIEEALYREGLRSVQSIRNELAHAKSSPTRRAPCAKIMNLLMRIREAGMTS